MGREYQRNLGPAGCLTSGQYTRVDGVTLCCKRCGKRSVLAQRVLSGGMVSGVWTCPARCGESDFITLCDFAEPVVG